MFWLSIHLQQTRREYPLSESGKGIYRCHETESYVCGYTYIAGSHNVSVQKQTQSSKQFWEWCKTTFRIVCDVKMQWKKTGQLIALILSSWWYCLHSSSSVKAVLMS